MNLDQRRVSARFRLAMSYAAFLVAAGLVTLVGVYIVLRYVPAYPMSPANPADAGGSVASRGEILNAVVGVSGILLASLAVVGVTGGWLLAGRVLRPLQRINAAALLAASGSLDHRIRLSGRNDEFRQLADTFDHMLDRLADAFAVQERFAANASHELRTPLTITRTLLEVAHRNPKGQDYPSLLDRLTITNTRAVDLIDALLRLADADAITAVSEPVDLGIVMGSAMDENSVEAAERGIIIRAHLGPAPIMGDVALLAQLASNLIQNAVRHNTGSGTAVITTAHCPGRGSVHLRVASSGESFTAQQASRLHEPFLRGAGRVVDGNQRHRGHGLGLALVARIVEVHRGSLHVTPRAEGGLIIDVALPDAASVPSE